MTDGKHYTCVGRMVPDRDGMWILAMERDPNGMWILAMERDALRAERDEWQRKFTALNARLVRLEGAIEDFLEGEMQGNVLGLRQAWKGGK